MLEKFIMGNVKLESSVPDNGKEYMMVKVLGKEYYDRKKGKKVKDMTSYHI